MRVVTNVSIEEDENGVTYLNVDDAELSNITPWDLYAAAALSKLGTHPQYAAQDADELLAQRNKRFPVKEQEDGE